MGASVDIDRRKKATRKRGEAKHIALSDFFCTLEDKLAVSFVLPLLSR